MFTRKQDSNNSGKYGLGIDISAGGRWSNHRNPVHIKQISQTGGANGYKCQCYPVSKGKGRPISVYKIAQRKGQYQYRTKSEDPTQNMYGGILGHQGTHHDQIKSIRNGVDHDHNIAQNNITTNRCLLFFGED